MRQKRYPATLFRGGTSNGIYFRKDALPSDRDQWDKLLLALFGSPDPMQLDGVGGSHSTTSKAMIVWASEDPDIDVEYRFGQIGVEKPVVDWGGNCGNLTFAVGPYALERELVSPAGGARDKSPMYDERSGLDDAVELVLRNENTDTIVEQEIPVTTSGKPRIEGEFKVNGVPGTGARIRSRFLDPGGSVTNRVFPTGNRIDLLSVDGVGEIEVSLLDVTSPCVFARATDLGMCGTELPDELGSEKALLERIERVRSAACARYGFVDDSEAATSQSPGIPKLALVGERATYKTVGGATVAAEDYDLLARIMSMQKPHHAYAVTGAMCTAVAAAFPDTIPNEYINGDRPDAIELAHPKGTMEIGLGIEGDSVNYTRVDRTARQLFVGEICHPPLE